MTLPVFKCEIAFGNTPADASPTWTDVSSDLRKFQISRGRQYELNQIDPGSASVTLKNLSRQYDPEYTSGPHFPNVVPLVPIRLSAPGTVPANAGPLTVSGNEITDASRLAALSWGTTQQGGSTDGAAIPGGVGLWEAGTNLFTSGQCDTTNGYLPSTSGVTVPAPDATVPAPFSPQSIKAVCDGSIVNQGFSLETSPGLAAVAGTLCVGSAYFKGVAGKQYLAEMVWLNTDSSFTAGLSTVFVATGAWQLVAPASGVAVAAGKTGNVIALLLWQVGTPRAETVWAAHPMIQSGVAFVSPYVATSAGATATRAGARVQALASLLDETQGWFAIRMKMGWDSTTSLDPADTNPCPMYWADDGTHRIALFWFPAGGEWLLERSNGTNLNVAKTSSFAVGDELTLVAAWDSGHIYLSVNGSAFTSVANTAIPTLAASMFDIGSLVGSVDQVNANILWTACGTGKLTDADAATIAAIPDTPTVTNGYYDHDASRLLWPTNANLTAYWPAVTASYRAPTDARLFTGYVARWPQNRTGPNYAETQLECVDGFELLNQAIMPAVSYSSTKGGVRITDVLNTIGWPSGATNIPGGFFLVPPITILDSDGLVALQHIQDAQDAEAGMFFIAGNGKATYVDARSLIQSPYTISQATLTDKPALDTGAIGYSDMTPSLDKDLIYNDWRGTRDGGATKIAADSTSITDYFRRTQVLTPLLASDTDVQSLMSYFLAQYKQPILRFGDITVTPGADAGSWLQVLSREIGDRLTVRDHPVGGGRQIVKDVHISRLNLTVETHTANAKLIWSTLPADLTSYFILNDPTNGVLNTSKLGI